MKIEIQYHPLQFIRPAGTSRGVMTEKQCWIVRVEAEGNVGLGEISIIEGLSKEFQSRAHFEQLISYFVEKIELLEISYDDLLESIPELITYPSILFGFEAALLDLKNGGKQIYFDNEFTSGSQPISINGLIWMGNEDYLQEQVEQKLAAGFSTIKMKVGAIDFDSEIKLLKSIRDRFTSDQITLRVDANGAFSKANALGALQKLAELEIHSIEQPIAPGQWEQMRDLCKTAPIPIALDEELIGIHIQSEKVKLLNCIQPQFIILKPSLHGGIAGVYEWIKLAEERNIAWWMTSALESNIGLNVIAQFTAEFQNKLPQGLGTGALFQNNFESSLQIKNGQLFRVPA